MKSGRGAAGRRSPFMLRLRRLAQTMGERRLGLAGIIIFVGLVGLGCRSTPEPAHGPPPNSGESSGAMSQSRLADVLARHTHALLAVPGVLGTGEGEEAGRPVFLVLVDRATPELRARIPSTIEGYPVVIRETGKVKALDRR